MTEMLDVRRKSFEELLGVDLHGLVREISRPLLHAQLVTTMPSGHARGSFRLIFGGGLVLKGRIVRTTEDVDRIVSLGGLLDPRYFPPVVAHRGHALLTVWISGEPFRMDADHAALRTCGRLHGALHRVSLPRAFAQLRRRSADWNARLEGALAELADNGIIDAGLARATNRLAVDHAPATAHAGLCHTDLCAENIVSDAAGGIHVIDNEGVCVDAYEYDMARTWYRWPMTQGQARAYLEGYGRHDHTEGFANHFIYWASLALLESCVVRFRARAGSLAEPLRRLEELVRSRGGQPSFPRLLSLG